MCYIKNRLFCQLEDLVKVVDKAFEEFGLPKYYEVRKENDSSFMLNIKVTWKLLVQNFSVFVY